MYKVCLDNRYSIWNYFSVAEMHIFPNEDWLHKIVKTKTAEYQVVRDFFYLTLKTTLTHSTQQVFSFQKDTLKLSGINFCNTFTFFLLIQFSIFHGSVQFYNKEINRKLAKCLFYIIFITSGVVYSGKLIYCQQAKTESSICSFKFNSKLHEQGYEMIAQECATKAVNEVPTCVV